MSNRMDERAKKAYSIIENNANSTMLIEGLSGFFGFPWTILADGAIVFTHYAPMVNNIRKIYGRKALQEDSFVSLVKSLQDDILADLLLDHLAGQIPLVGVYFNLICAKAMTWRIGLLIALVSARGEQLDYESMHDAMNLIRKLSPQSGIFRFYQPIFLEFLVVERSVRDKSVNYYKKVVATALNEITKGVKVKNLKLEDLDF